MINNLGTPSSELQINFDVLQIDTENSATGLLSRAKNVLTLSTDCHRNGSNINDADKMPKVVSMLRYCDSAMEFGFNIIQP